MYLLGVCRFSRGHRCPLPGRVISLLPAQYATAPAGLEFPPPVGPKEGAAKLGDSEDKPIMWGRRNIARSDIYTVLITHSALESLSGICGIAESLLSFRWGAHPTATRYTLNLPILLYIKFGALYAPVVTGGMSAGVRNGAIWSDRELPGASL